MPYRPPAPGRRRILIEMPDDLVAYLDAEANRRCCSRAAFLRMLVVRDREAQGIAAGAA